MKRFFVLLTFTLATLIATNAQSGLIKVKVTDDNGLNLPGASVLVPALKIASVTDASGWAFLYKVPTGKQSILITYIGYSDTSVLIDVANNTQEINISLKAGVKMLKGVIVLGDRLKGQAKALNQQKNASNISNIVSADQIGRFPDANIGDALKRVPGITMQNDQGEARDIIIRGLAPQLNSVTLNGDRIPSAEGDNRKIQMDLIPADMVQTMEVSKTLTADMDADAIGGSVNLVTRTAPNKFRLSGTGSYGYNIIRDGSIANLSLIAGGRLWKNRIGVIASMNINDNTYGSDNVEAVWAKAANGVAYVAEHDVRKYDVRRKRRSFNITSDIKINKKNTVTISGIYNWRDDWENRFRNRVTGITPLDAGGNAITLPTQTIASYRGEVRIQTKGGVSGNRTKNARLEEQTMKKASIKGEHIIGKNVKLEWSSSYSRAGEYRPNERYLEYNRTNQTLTMDIADERKPYVFPTVALTPANINFRRFTEQIGEVNETEWNNKLSLKIPVKLFENKETVIKIGGRYSKKEKERINDFYRYAPTGATQTGMANLGIIPNANYTDRGFQADPKYAVGTFATPQYVGSFDFSNPAYTFTKTRRFEEFLALNYSARENISAGFISINQQLSEKLSMVLGARIERTKIDYTGNTVFNTTQLKGDTTIKNSYTNFLPSINFKYNANKDLIFRAAVTTAIARPGYYELVPYRNVLGSDNQVTVGNPNLKATSSVNVDLMVEKYYKSVGLISGGIFYKRLNNFIYTYSENTYDSLDYQNEFNPAPGDNPIPAGNNWIYRQSRNGESVNVYGIELAFQRQLDFLPGWMKGFGVYFNYTYTKSQSDGIYNTEGVKRENLALPGTAPHMFNASLSYENSKFLARIAVNYTAAYLDEVGATDFQDRFYDKQMFVDFNTSYAISPKLRAFAEINNITNQPLRYYSGVKERTAQIEYYRVRWNTGIKFDIF